MNEISPFDISVCTSGPWIAVEDDRGNWNVESETEEIIGSEGFYRCDGSDEANAHLAAAAYEMRQALYQVRALIDVALPQFNWGASALSAEAIRLLNDTPGIVNAALAKSEPSK